MPETTLSTPSSRWSNELLNAMRWQQDPVADAFLKQVVETEGQPQAMQIFNVLIHHIGIQLPDLPDYAAAYFTETAALPSWADTEQIRLGQQLFAEHGPSMMALLFFKALPTTYLPTSTSKVLIRTGRLAESEDKMARYGRRVGETAQFVLDVMSMGNLAPGGKGIATTQKIRLIHASIRLFLPKEEWDETAWQLPVNQEDMAITILTFSVSLVEGLESLGVRVPDAQREAYVHLWKVVGHLLGIHPDLQPQDFADGKDLLERILQRHQASTEEGHILTKALLDFGKEMTPGNNPVLKEMGPLMLGYYLGDERARLLGVEMNSGCLGVIMPLFFRKMVGMSTRLEERSEPLDLLADKAGKLIMRGMVRAVRKAKGAPFDIPEDMKARWELDKETED